MTAPSHITPICKDCAKKVAMPPDKKGNPTEPTKATMMEVLDWLRKPFSEALYNQCVATATTGGVRDVFTGYMMQI